MVKRMMCVALLVCCACQDPSEWVERAQDIQSPNHNSTQDSTQDSGDDEMASSYAPDNWQVLTGTWGTDVDRNDSNSYSGNHSIVMNPTAVATKVESPSAVPLATDKGSPISVFVVLAQDGTPDPADTVTIKAYAYDKDNTLLYWKYIWNGPLTTAPIITSGTGGYLSWRIVGASVPDEYNGASVMVAPARIAVSIEKAAREFTLYIDSINGSYSAPSRQLVANANGGAQTIPGTSTWTPVVTAVPTGSGGISYILNRETKDNSGATPYGVYLPIAGPYWAHATIKTSTELTGSEYVDLRLVYSPDGGTTKRYYYGNKSIVAGLGEASVTALLQVEPTLSPALVWIEAWTNHADGVITVYSTTNADQKSYFHVAKVSR